MLGRRLVAVILLSTLGLGANAQIRVTETCQSDTACGVIVFDGDSVSAGSASTPGHSPDQQLARLMPRPVKVFDVAVGGRPVYECLALFDNGVAPLYDPRGPFDIILFHAGDNDIAHHKTAVEAYQALTDYIAKAHRQGWKFVISTELDRPKFPPDFQRELTEYNRLVRKNAAGADAVVDFGGDPRMAAPEARGNPAVFASDGVHPSDGGYAILADMLIKAIQPMIR
jgi:lysophospholipase L1-like esterase